MIAILRHRDFRLIAAGQLLSGLGDWLLLVAAPFYALRLTGSTPAAGMAMAAEFVPALLIGPLAGVFADRWDRRRTMVVTDVARAAAIAAMLLIRRPEQVWILYAALLVEAGFSQFFTPAARALVPAVIGRGPELTAAKSVSAFVGGTVRLIGGPLGGALYAVAGFHTVASADAVSYLASAGLITAIRYRTGPAGVSSRRAPLQAFAADLRAGVAHVRGTAELPRVFLTAGVFFVGNAMLTALLVPYVGGVLHGGATTMGWLFTALGVGYLAGAPVSRVMAARFEERRMAIGSLSVLAVVFAAAFDIRYQWPDLVFFALIGPPAVCFLVTVDVVVARVTPDRLLGRTSAVHGTVQSAATLLGMLAGADLGQWIGVGVTLNIAVFVVATAAASAVLIPAPATRALATRAPAAPALAGSASSFSGLWLPPGASRRLAVVSYRIEVPELLFLRA